MEVYKWYEINTKDHETINEQLYAKKNWQSRMNKSLDIQTIKIESWNRKSKHTNYYQGDWIINHESLGDSSIIVLWVIPFFPFWFTSNWTSVTEQKYLSTVH